MPVHFVGEGFEMRRSLAGLAALSVATVLYSAPTQAQVGIAPGYNWSGLYLGANVGGGFGSNEATAAPGTDAASLAFWGPTFNLGSAPTSFKIHESGVIGGVQARYNWQFGSAVLGLDAEADGAHISGKKSTNTAPALGFVPGTSSVS